MVPGMEELGPTLGMMDEADRMPVIRMGVPVQAPTPADVAVVRPAQDADPGEDSHQDPSIEDTGVKPVSGAAGMEPLPGEEPCEQERGDRRHDTRTIAPRPVARFGEKRDRLRIPRTSSDTVRR